MRELVLTRRGEKLCVYLLEHRHLVEYHEVVEGGEYALGDIFLGSVSQVNKGLNAAFVDIGLVREGFLHVSDIAPGFFLQRAYVEALRRAKRPSVELLQVEASPPKEASIAEYLHPGDWILVQVVKEMSDTKGPRLSTQVSLTGQGLVLLPFSTEIGISHRIVDPVQRQAWREQLKAFYRAPYGMILRTGGQKLSPPELEAEYSLLIQKWEDFQRKLQGKKPPYRLSEGSSSITQVIQDYLNSMPEVIYVADETLYAEIQQYFQIHRLLSPPALRLHRKKEPLESYFEVDRATRLLLGRTVTLPNGGYIVIERTEALHVIDVNSGSLAAQNRPPEEVALQTNLLAAQEIARQLRLRDLGGIIVVDFIDMRSAEHRRLVYERLCEAMKADRAKHVVLPMSEFGLVQITRQRRRAPVEPSEEVPCPTCHGKGYLAHTAVPYDRIEEQLVFWGKAYPRAILRVKAHPLLVAYWREKYAFSPPSWIWNLLPHRWLQIEEDKDLPLGRALLYQGSDWVALLE
ncbi:MAG: ribonuclease G [Bacteroidia bacterium]|nr:MAG: ribonuclease G [Bacteroidia bacterium]